MDRCYLNRGNQSKNSRCICSDEVPKDSSPCIVQFDGQSGGDFASSIISNTGSFLSSSGLLGMLALSLGISVLFRLKG